jgi:hypothetical protein
MVSRKFTKNQPIFLKKYGYLELAFFSNILSKNVSVLIPVSLRFAQNLILRWKNDFSACFLQEMITPV